MSVRVTITDHEIDILCDLADGDSVADPSDSRYETLMAFIDKVAQADKRPPDIDAAIARNNAGRYE